MVVLEARTKVGGAVDTSYPFPNHPDIGVSTYSYVMSLMPNFIIEELHLRDHGYRVTAFGPYYQAFPDGRSITIFGDDPKRTHASVSQFSPERRRHARRMGSMAPRGHRPGGSAPASRPSESRIVDVR